MNSTLDRIVQSFRDPPREFSPVPTWWWSGEKVTAARLRWQLEQYAGGGVFNLIVMNLAAAGPMHGSDADDPPFFSEEWWTLFLGACDDARRLGIRLWFYDQIGFSGANFQGRLVSAHPSWAAQALESIVVPAAGESGVALPPQTRELARIRRNGQVRVVYTVDRGFDYFNPAACAALLDTVHGEFERRAGRLLGNVIAGSFQDELPSMPAWSPGFAAAFQSRNGYSILGRLGALWEDDGEDAAQVRIDYQRTRAGLAERSFFEPLAKWHEKFGLLCGCDQQSPSRAADPKGSTTQYADYLLTHRWYSAPGSDHDGHAKVHSSLAHLYNRPRVWLEAFHSTGWGGTLEETFDWLLPWFLAGVNLYAPHADYYSTRGGWWEWAPPSTCWRQPYFKQYPQFAATVSRMCHLLAQGSHVCDIAVLYPTTTMQAGTFIGGVTDHVARANARWFEVVGRMKWADPKSGWLDRCHRDYDVIDEASLARAEVRGGRLAIGEESFSTFILPACTHLPDGAAERLSQFVAAGGQLIAIDGVPVALQARARLVRNEQEFADAIRERPARVEASVPTLHRRIGELNVLLVGAIDGMATRVDPPPKEWWARRSYSFDRQRYAEHVDVLLRGVASAPFLLDPFDGGRKPVEWRETADGIVATVPFESGPAQFLAWSAAPDEKFQPLEIPPEKVPTIGTFSVPISNHWKSELVHTTDNRHGDFTWPAAPGPLPVQACSCLHRAEAAPGEGLDARWFESEPSGAGVVQAGYGRRGWKAGPLPIAQLAAAPREEVVYSLERGLFKDPVHIETLGPKGHVAEDFIHFGTTRPGEGVRFRTSVWMDSAIQTQLAIGSAGAKRAWVNGRELVEESKGFLWLAPVELARGRNIIEWEVAPEEAVNLRAYWALVDHPEKFQRPEWMAPADAPRANSRVFFNQAWNVEGPHARMEVQLGCNAPCRLVVNGLEAGRQGGFDPYSIGMRFERYRLDSLREGANDISIEALDLGQPVTVLVDAFSESGQRWMSGPAWWVHRESGGTRAVKVHRPQFKEIGWSHLWRRPPPLPRSNWLETARDEGVVRDVVPDAPPLAGSPPAEWLWFTIPPGTRRMHVPGLAAFRSWVDGREYRSDARGDVELGSGAAPSRRVAIRFEPGRGCYGGGFLSGPIICHVGEGTMRTGDWAVQGLDSYAGGVRYRQTVAIGAPVPTGVVLDLGEVRGTAEVRVNGRPAGARFVGPWRFDLSGLLQAGANELDVTVYNTLAPWLEAHSPTRCIWAGTTAGGLFGPVRIRYKSQV